MDPIGTFVFERVEETDDMLATRVRRLRLYNAIQELNLVDGGFGVVSGGTNDFEGDVFTGGGIAGQPDGGEMAPAQLAHDDIATVVIRFADRNRVIAALAVVF